jgi:hypothetical protein
MKVAFTPILVAIIFAAISMAGQTPQSEPAMWEYSKWTKPMTGVEYDQFVLHGKYLTPPSQADGNGPKLVVHCSDGKLRRGEFFVGAVVRHDPGAHSLKGIVQSQVQMRMDDKKKLDDDWWEISNDWKTLFFDRQQLAKLMTGRLLGHPSDQNSLIHRLTLGVVESLENQIVMQFEMPQDDAQIVESCGLEWGKEKKRH